jgi:hypothetical protein
LRLFIELVGDGHVPFVRGSVYVSPVVEPREEVVEVKVPTLISINGFCPGRLSSGPILDKVAGRLSDQPSMSLRAFCPHEPHDTVTGSIVVLTTAGKTFYDVVNPSWGKRCARGEAGKPVGCEK